MREIALTEAQHERLQEVRDELREEFIGAYGTVRVEDAIEYLLDTYTRPTDRGASEAYTRLADADYAELQDVASSLPSVPGSGISAEEMRGRLLTELDPEELVARLDGGQDGSPSEEQLTDRTNERDDEPTADQLNGDDVDESNASGTTSESETPGPDSDATPEASLRTAANRLLEEHDDKWRESDGDAPYEVDLPDGTTETARTKDDVRQLLFRKY